MKTNANCEIVALSQLEPPPPPPPRPSRREEIRDSIRELYRGTEREMRMPPLPDILPGTQSIVVTKEEIEEMAELRRKAALLPPIEDMSGMALR